MTRMAVDMVKGQDCTILRNSVKEATLQWVLSRVMRKIGWQTLAE